MNRYTKLSGYTLLLLLAALVLVTSSVAAVGLDRFERVQAVPAQVAQNDEPVNGPWGPPVGPEPSGETIRLAPLAIGAADGAVQSDDFNVCDLDTDLWTFINPVTDASYATTGAFTEDAWLEIDIPSGEDHDIWLEGNFAPRVMQSIGDADLDIESSFESRVAKKYQMQGILVEESADTFLRFEFYSDGDQTWALAAIFEPGITDPLTATIKYRQPAPWSKWTNPPFYMRVRRQGDVWNQFLSKDGEEWTQAASFIYPMTTNATGIYGANVSNETAPGFVAEFDYFFNRDLPIDPEDGAQNSLVVDVVGTGTVTKDPLKDPYTCGETVAVTPVPGPGWSFDEWTGVHADKLQDNGDGTWSVVMNRPIYVTANFVADEYSLTTDTEGPGTLGVDPIKPFYIYGDVVTLTPNPQPTFIFAKWLGTSKDDPVDNGDGTWSLTMDSDKQVTALFTENEHTLTLAVVGSGTTSPTPGDHIYEHNQTATITVTPAAGWSFSEWLGVDKDDLVYEGGNEWSVLMDSDKSVQARFRQAQYDIDITIIGPGTVNKAPSPPYLYGDIVTLTPIPDSAAVGFARWGGPDVGDLIDNGNGTWRLMMDENKLLTATFATFQIYVPLVTNSP